MAAATVPPPSFLAPLHAFVAWLVRPLQPAPATVPAPTRVTGAAGAITHRRPQKAPRVVRVVRVVETADKAGAGRMVISGRMADVCAELDRLAALEATRH